MEDVSVAEVSPDDVDLAGVFLLLGCVTGQLREGDLLDALDGLWEGVVVVVDDCSVKARESASESSPRAEKQNISRENRRSLTSDLVPPRQETGEDDVASNVACSTWDENALDI